MVNTTPWLTCYKPNPPARVRLFCFPYAGGSAAIFRNWHKHLPEYVEVCPVQLPGRSSHMSGPPFTNLAALIEPLARALRPYLDKPFAFFGHSMGAIISFELARYLRKRFLPRPLHLFVSGRTAPQIPEEDPGDYDLPEPEFMQRLRNLNGTPREVLDHPELMELMIPLLRADFALIQTYAYSPEPPLNIPITVFGGTEDTEVAQQHLEAWREQTNSSFALRMLSGDHFFLLNAESQLLSLLDLQFSKHLLTAA
jgi:medium-chain acyl-[acyl-carrier-protein] hydrolase